MHLTSFLAPLLVAVPATLAQHVHYEPPEVFHHVQSMMHHYKSWAHYPGPSPTWMESHPHPPYPTQTTPPPPPNQCSYWMENIKHQGVAAFNPNPQTYQVFRNVKDFGAKGDGMTDDTAAINNAISYGGRCAPGSCNSTTTTPAVVYFPAGVYMINSSIIDYYYTQLIGNPNCLPVIRAFSTFNATNGSIGLIDGDTYLSSGALAYGATNVFWRQIRNFILDMTQIPAGSSATGIHWPTGQATSIQNVIFNMNSDNGTQHQGLFIEQGSGGFVNDLVFNGGMAGGVFGYYNISINNCTTGLNIYSGGPTALAVGSVTFFDSSIKYTPVGIRTGYTANSQPPTANSLILENIQLDNVPVAVEGGNNQTALAGTPSITYISAWGEGHAYTPTGPNTFQGYIQPVARPPTLLQSNGRYYQRSKPQYEHNPVSDFISARDVGATGNGHTDDTVALQKAINLAVAQHKILYIDHGDYLVSNTIYIPSGAKIVGESYSVILSYGEYFNDIHNPKPVVQIGKPGECGVIEWSDMIVSTQGQQQGAILFEYNLKSPPEWPSGIWDVHARIGGFAGSNLQLAQCPTTPNVTITAANLNYTCIASFLTFHVSKTGSGLYLENNWLWTADHDVEDPQLRQITIFTGRGLLVESEEGTIWLVGGAVEHNTKYEYQFVKTKAVFAGQIQTETAYYQPNPPAPLPFPFDARYNDPRFGPVNVTDGNYTIPNSDGWGLRIVDSEDILIYGAGFYSFFNNYSTNCSAQGNGEICQSKIVSVEGACERINVYNENTVGTHWMLTIQGVNSARFSENLDGFVDTIALFRYSS